MVAKPRVHQIAAEHGVDSKVALRILRDLGEFVKSPSSTIQQPVARKLRARLQSEGYLSVRFPGLGPETARFVSELFLELPRSLPRLVDMLHDAEIRGGPEMHAARLAQQTFYVAPEHLQPLATQSVPARMRRRDLPGGHGLIFCHQRDTLGHVIIWRNDETEVQFATCSIEVYDGGVVTVVGYSEFRIDAGNEELVSSVPAFRRLVQAWDLVPVRALPGGEPRPSVGSGRVPPPEDGATRLIRYWQASEDTESRSKTGGPRRAKTRWNVRGHWRNQYYKGSDEHRRVWIEEHTAGAPGEEVSRTDRVFVLAPRP